MRLKDLRYLVTVGRTLCFREAARRCGIRSSTLIEQINRVELLLGVQVFERSRNGLFVTIAGREVLRLALGMTTIADHLMRAAGDTTAPQPARQPGTGSVRGQAPGLLAGALLTPP